MAPENKHKDHQAFAFDRFDGAFAHLFDDTPDIAVKRGLEATEDEI